MSSDRPVLVPLDPGLARRIAPQLLALINTIPGRPWSRDELLAKRWNKFRYSCVWLSGERPVGVVIVSQKQDRVHIHQVALEAEYQRQGLGREAYHRIAFQAQADGLVEMTAHCLLSEPGAVAFHTTLGFTEESHYLDPDDGLEYGRMVIPIATLLRERPAP